MQYKISSILFVILSTLFVGPQVFAADEVFVSIRAIHATRGKKIVLQKTTHTHEASIADLHSKLRKLPYDNFRLLSSLKRSVPFDKIEVLRLSQGHVLSFKPLSRKNDTVCLWLNWKDGSGAELLDTQLHLRIGESMIAGTEESQNEGVIVEVLVK